MFLLSALLGHTNHIYNSRDSEGPRKRRVITHNGRRGSTDVAYEKRRTQKNDDELEEEGEVREEEKPVSAVSLVSTVVAMEEGLDDEDDEEDERQAHERRVRNAFRATPRPEPREQKDKGIVRRNKRMFAGLLGTLNTAKQVSAE